MLIVDEIKQLAERVGVKATGTTIQSVVLSFKAALDERDAKQTKPAAVATFESEEPKRGKKKKAE